jgi:hypothetical protein
MTHLRISTGAWLLAAAALVPVTAYAQFPTAKAAPGFTLKRPDGTALSLASLRGKVVLLDFWGPT